MEEIIRYDTEFFLLLNNLGSEPWDELWRIITNKLTFIPLYMFLIYLVYKNYGLKETLVVLIIGGLMIATTDQLANLFKYILFKRPRPCREQELELLMRFVADGCGRYGYFSAHAASSMAAAVFLGLLLKPFYKALPFLLLLWASVVAYSRIYLGVHYPLDIITGMFFGAWIGLAVYKLNVWAQGRFTL